MSTPQLGARHKMCFIWSHLLQQYIFRESMSFTHLLHIIWFALPSGGAFELCHQSPHSKAHHSLWRELIEVKLLQLGSCAKYSQLSYLSTCYVQNRWILLNSAWYHNTWESYQFSCMISLPHACCSVCTSQRGWHIHRRSCRGLATEREFELTFPKLHGCAPNTGTSLQSSLWYYTYIVHTMHTTKLFSHDFQTLSIQQLQRKSFCLVGQ